MTEAATVNPEKVPTCTQECESIDWDSVIIIDTDTLKKLNADAKGYTAALEKLTAAQEKLVGTTEELTEANDDKRQLQSQLNNAESPPWYVSASFWAPVSFVAGVLTATALTVAIIRE